jgi:2-iminobutanoate/2-iminopropanoate deaminase
MRKREVINVPDGPPAVKFLSPAVRAGDLLYVSGNAGLPSGPQEKAGQPGWVPSVVSGGIEAETRQTLENLKLILEAAGGSLADVVKVNTFLRDVDRDFDAYNAVYLEYFPKNPPARTSVGAKILGKILIEIECVAYLPEGRGARD